jgi:hypothetical protein
VRVAAALAALLAVSLVAGCGGDGGKVVGGSGYEVTVPDGWEDRSDEGEDIEVGSFSPDVTLVGDREDGFTTNVNVIRTESGPLDIDEQVEAERDLLETGEIPGSDQEIPPAQDLSPIESITLDGEEARTYEFRLEQNERELRLRQVIAMHDGQNYAVTLTADPDDFDDGIDGLESILDSWSWD